MGWTNLDLKCAEAAEQILKLAPRADRQALEKLCSDAASVAVESGPYAFFLYLWSQQAKEQKRHEEQAAAVIQATARLLHELVMRGAGLAGYSDRDLTMRRMAELSTDLNRVLLARKLISRVMTYARYHAKAREERAAAGG